MWYMFCSVEHPYLTDPTNKNWPFISRHCIISSIYALLLYGLMKICTKKSRSRKIAAIELLIPCKPRKKNILHKTQIVLTHFNPCSSVDTNTQHDLTKTIGKYFAASSIDDYIFTSKIKKHYSRNYK